MKITDLARLVAKDEGGKKEVNIAQIQDVVKSLRRVVLDQSAGEIDLYKLFRKI